MTEKVYDEEETRQETAKRLIAHSINKPSRRGNVRVGKS